ncbi:MAG: (d)CMP kinase [Lachnospiraceae bacterium]|nr:(d)CMP kinase [Lachnospiraceae bacterium]
MKQVAVIGGGAAGMMAAITAAKEGAQVTIYEKNEKLGKKLYITGKGRCNLTNFCEPSDFFPNVVSNPKFLYSAVSSFTSKDTCAFFEDAGLRLKVERGNRVFPQSDKSSDVIKTLEKELKANHVKVCLHTEIKDISELKEDAVIIATGGITYPSTGSTGDGYRFAERIGHDVREPVQALVPLLAKDDFIGRLEGLSLRNVSAVVKNGKKKYYEGFGEMLFTDRGVSGPLVLSASSYIGRRLEEGECVLHIDLKPALSEEMLDARILRDFEEQKNKDFRNALGKLLPAKLIPVMVELSGIDPFKKVNTITKKEREQLRGLIKDLPIHLERCADVNQAVITSGGVSVKKIDPKTMESKLQKNVYFAGEVLDVDALTGGFNLQIAFSTGYAAGKAAAKGTDMKQIAIDGPAGAGKSTVAKILAERLDYMYVDTGAMYRTIALACIRKGIDLADEAAVSKVCEEADISIKYENGVQVMYLDGENVSEAIRNEEVSKAASDTSKFLKVRERLVLMQRDLTKEYNVIMDGRDIGTAVLPDATLKIYLTASVQVRAERRYKEYKEKGIACELEEIKKDIEQRDHNDMTREISPLRKADDAVEVDTSDLTIDEVVQKIIDLWK